MGINVITIADWERGERPLSKEHDYELRRIALASLLGRIPKAGGHSFESLARDMENMLTAPRLTGPPKRPKHYLIRTTKLAAA